MFFSLSIAAILLKDNAPPAAHWPQEGRSGYPTTTKPALKTQPNNRDGKSDEFLNHADKRPVSKGPLAAVGSKRHS